MAMPWIDELKKYVEKKPIVILNFAGSEWEQLRDSRRSINEFTIARNHTILEGLKVPTLCLICGKSSKDEQLYFGIISSKAPVTTIESRIKVRRSMQILPKSKSELLRLITEKPYIEILKHRLRGNLPINTLSPKLSSLLIDKLAAIGRNGGAMRALAESLFAPKRFHGTAELQEDAVQTALKAFGLEPRDQVLSLELVAGCETALARVSIMEDSVIEHDARHIHGYDLMQSDLTGHAVFKRGDEQLDVFTANRRPLEHCFGVDLIYLNASRQNIVMLQYKMLEPMKNDSDDTDWIYRPDAKLDDEIRRMKKFAVDHKPHLLEYRLNPAVFYLKFVKRDGSIRNGGIITPLDHFEKLRKSPLCKGPKKGLRVSYTSLEGRYLRQHAFLDLIRSGYIGAHAEKTEQLKVLVDAVLKSDRAVVAAIQRPQLEA